MKTLTRLKSECSARGLTLPEDRGRSSKEPYIAALRDHHWRRDHPVEPIPPQIAPMLLGSSRSQPGGLSRAFGGFITAS